MPGLRWACKGDANNMAKVQVERIGGLAGFGGARSRVRSRGEIEWTDVSPADQQALDSLFQSPGNAKPSQVRDGFRYRITRTTAKGLQTIEAPEEAVPMALRQSVKDEIV